MESTINQSVESTTYTLTKTTLKNGKFHYVVTDNNGNIISERKSNRNYVACTACGSNYFGRLDLIGKGDHGKWIDYVESKLALSDDQIDPFSIKFYGSIEAFRKATQEQYTKANSIAYLNK